MFSSGKANLVDVRKGYKMPKTIYLGHFDNQDKRVTSPAGITMMEYIISAITRQAGGCVVVSPALSKKEKLAREVVDLDDNVQVIYLASKGNAPKWNFCYRTIKKLFSKRNLDMELERIVEDNDTLVVYHSLSLMNAVKRIIKKKNVNFVLQVCEIYSDVIGDKEKRKKEIEFIRQADSYIFSSKMLEEQLNVNKKNYAICLGTYNIGEKLTTPLMDDKIHAVYAGTLDSRKGGATAATAAAEHLDENYHIHILGFGSQDEIDYINNQINKISKISKCAVTYDGCLSGEEYLKFIQGCHVGLSTQNPDADFNATSFPSKILSYLSNGLRVVSIRIPAIETSAVGEHLYFYDVQTPQEIAKAIISVNISDDKDGRRVVSGLDKQFCLDLRQVLGCK